MAPQVVVLTAKLLWSRCFRIEPAHSASMISQLELRVFLLLLGLGGATGCDTVTVSGLPADCISSPCGGCNMFADALNGDYERITDLVSQMVDPTDESAGQLPVCKDLDTPFVDTFHPEPGSLTPKTRSH